jgi:hypothetical protein
MKVKKRPTCVHCRKAYGLRVVTEEKVKRKIGEDKPEYQGNGFLVREVEWQTGALVDPKGHYTPASEIVTYRKIWDGVTYSGGYHPFCTLHCALAYARKAYNEKIYNQLNPNRKAS